jgi:hypothetical protein
MRGHSQTSERRVRLWMPLACIVVVLVATVGQALDSCEFLALRTHQEVSAKPPAGRQASPCLICMAAHSSPLVANLTRLTPVLHTVEAVSISERAPHSALQIFGLYTRPPPSL